jgi:hypothetical protein
MDPGQVSSASSDHERTPSSFEVTEIFIVYISRFSENISAAKHTAPPIKHSPEVNIFSTLPTINSARPAPDSAAVIKLSFVIIYPLIYRPVFTGRLVLIIPGFCVIFFRNALRVDLTWHVVFDNNMFGRYFSATRNNQIPSFVFAFVDVCVHDF